MPNSLTDVAAPVIVLTIGAVLTLASVFNRSGLQLAAGVVLLVVALLGPDATRLSIRAPAAELTLERQLPREDGRSPELGAQVRERMGGGTIAQRGEHSSSALRPTSPHPR